MDKIKALLAKVGVKEELAEEICKSLANYKDTLREQFENEYAAKVAQAKKVCIEETEAHKRELARRVQIFCETKGAAIEAQLAKQSAHNESEAVAKLRNVMALLEGLEPNGTPNGDVTAIVAKHKQKAQVAVEERDKAVATANRQTALCEKALKTNRALATENQQLKKKLESGAQTVTEGKQSQSRQKRRLDQQRSSGQPVSSRATILENQDRQPPAKSNEPHVSGGGSQSNYSVETVAGQMEADLV